MNRDNEHHEIDNRLDAQRDIIELACAIANAGAINAADVTAD